MTVTIVITNYNYGRYVGQAIESALAQTWPDLQVVVVDDGSTDDSWEVIRRFGDRVTSLRIANSGQGGASNAGLARAEGEFVLFLDSDDLLDSGCVATCMPLFAAHVAKVQFALQRIDAAGRPLGGTVPYLMHDGDVRPMLHAFGQYAGPPSSGNFYRRSAIERYYPIAPALWRRAADAVPFLLAPFNGLVANAPRPLGAYRLHSASASPGVLGNAVRSYAEELEVDAGRRLQAFALLARVDGVRVEEPFLPLPWSVRTRALSWKLERVRHPFPDDTAWSLLRLQAQAMRAWPGYRRMERWAALLWVIAAAVLPSPLAARLARTNASASARTLCKRLAGRPV